MSQTELLYLPEPDKAYEKEFTARVIEASKNHVTLDRTLFYPTGGGQPHDVGTLETDETIRITSVRNQKGAPRHEVDGTPPSQGATVTGRIDWDRRHALMRMHTAQHILSAIAYETFGATTKGNQIHTDYSRVDFDVDTFTEEQLETLQAEANTVIDDDIHIEGYEEDRDKLKERIDVERTLLHLIPDHIKRLRVVEIPDVDICPCAGTHVKRTGEIGELTIQRTRSKGKGRTRIVYDLQTP